MTHNCYSKSSILLVLFSMVFLFCSCKKKNTLELSPEAKAYVKDLESNYYKSRSAIVRHQVTEYDLVPDIRIPISGNVILGQLVFFNYGGDIILFRGFEENCFINGIGTVIVAFPIDNRQLISIAQVKENETYGSWAYATVYFGNNIVRDAFVTPLAYDAYTNGDISDLMLVVLESSKRYLAAVFKADPRVHLMAMSSADCIYRDKDIINIEAPINGPGFFWHLKNE